MNLTKKILVSLPDANLRRKVRMLLAGAGFDVRAFSGPAACLEGLRHEWFDLALLSERFGDVILTDEIRRIQPTLPVILLVDQLEFPAVVQGLRKGITDVFVLDNEGRGMVTRVCAFFNMVPNADADLSSEELARADEILSALGAGEQPALADKNTPPEAAIMQAARDKALLERQLERVANERNDLEAQLRALITQHGDVNRLAARLDELKTQREIVTSAQAAIEEKAKMLNSLREEIRRERGELEKTRQNSSGGTASPIPNNLAAEWAEIGAWRKRLAEQSEKVQSEATRLQQDRAQLASERRDWHRDLDQLREQEDNLRHYEAKLRELQAQLETERVSLLGAQAKASTPAASFEDQSALEAGWIKFKRATELFEAERAHLREDRLAVREAEKALKLRELTLATREERLRAASAAAQAAAEVPAALTPPPQEASTADRVMAFTRAPFAAAKAVFKGKNST